MIFERFYKQDEFVQGTGLGLSISMVIAEKLGGKSPLAPRPEREAGSPSPYPTIMRVKNFSPSDNI